MYSIISYIVIIFLTFIFTYIFQIKENFILLYMLLIAPFIDGFLFLYLKRGIKINLNCSSEGIEKNEIIICTIEINNSAFIPVPFFDYEFDYNNKLICDEKVRMRTSLSAKEITRKELVLKAAHRGIGEVNLNNIYIRSILGLFKSEIDFEELNKKITIMPEVKEVGGMRLLLAENMDSEDNEDAANNAVSGEPGYEFKEYSEGDSLNRVNWKLTAKRNIIMIRKNLTEIKHKKIIILDPAIVKRGEYEKVEDLLIESMLGVSRDFQGNNFEIEVLVRNERGWKTFEIDSVETLVALQIYFSSYNFIGATSISNRFTNIINKEEEGCDYIIFTAYKNLELANLISVIEERGQWSMVISNDKGTHKEEELHLTMDYCLERI